jgi:hypothetical protein
MHCLGEDGQEFFRILGIRRSADFHRSAGLPVFPHLQIMGPRGKAVAWRKPQDPLKEGARSIFEKTKKMVGYSGFVQVPGNSRKREQSLDLSRKSEVLARVEVEEGLYPEVVPSAKDVLFFGVPDRKRKIPKQPIYAGLTPSFVRREGKLAVRDVPCRARESALVDQFAAIVDAGIAGDGDRTCRYIQRKCFVKRFGRGVPHAVS